MILPFFIQKLWDITPKIKFTYINHDKVNSRQGWDNFRREWQRNNSQPRAGYIKHYNAYDKYNELEQLIHTITSLEKYPQDTLF